jgi:hypothetical protein
MQLVYHRQLMLTLEDLTYVGAKRIQGYVSKCSTVWRKKNACFSNNCNFVYFQYNKIMSTPKQPVINAVLITHIDYSFTENYIETYTRTEPLLKVLHHIY